MTRIALALLSVLALPTAVDAAESPIQLKDVQLKSASPIYDATFSVTNNGSARLLSVGVECTALDARLASLGVGSVAVSSIAVGQTAYGSVTFIMRKAAPASVTCQLTAPRDR